MPHDAQRPWGKFVAKTKEAPGGQESSFFRIRLLLSVFLRSSTSCHNPSNFSLLGWGTNSSRAKTYKDFELQGKHKHFEANVTYTNSSNRQTVRTPRSGQEKLRNFPTGLIWISIFINSVDFQARRSGPGAHGGAMPYKHFEVHV